MIIGVCKVELRLPGSHSLKDKRSWLKSLLRRIKNKFNVAAAEVDNNDRHQLSTIALTTVSNQSKHVDKQLDKVVKYIEQDREVQLVDYEFEFL